MNRLGAVEAFVRVVDAGSFCGAARQLRIGRSAVSKTIAQLEERLGVAAFDERPDADRGRSQLLRPCQTVDRGRRGGGTCRAWDCSSPVGSLAYLRSPHLHRLHSCRACRSFSPSFPAGRQASAKARAFASFQGRHLQPTQQQVDSLIDDRAASGESRFPVGDRSPPRRDYARTALGVPNR